MSGSSVEANEQTELARARKIAWLFVLSAVVFFPLIMNPLIFGFFDAESGAERLEHVEENLSGLRLLFTGIGVTELALGAALWLWGRSVGARTPGRRGEVARAFAWIGLAAGCIALLARVTAWFENAESLASDDLGVAELLIGLPAGLGFSSTMFAFGWLMIRGSMPTWLGIVWIACALLFWLGILPLWFFVGALVFGVRGHFAFRPGHGDVEQIGAVRRD